MSAQVKSKQRVQEHGEVFTNEREVDAMLDMVKQETERIESRFLEPACGDGNFLAVVLRRKLAVVGNLYRKSPSEYMRYAFRVPHGLPRAVPQGRDHAAGARAVQEDHGPLGQGLRATRLTGCVPRLGDERRRVQVPPVRGRIARVHGPQPPRVRFERRPVRHGALRRGLRPDEVAGLAAQPGQHHEGPQQRDGRDE